ncbi:hypothetical protein [Kordiimonas sp. SCSIO 12610]|uniref:hypothetical protein n=1 Tax=Kordiimonas sp. SCSIO 12610 TaxID=2829597 RepID=UPI00210A04C0|nr:hypothetical protein [Kordiimonas sp. SCSIO 12610]UTW55410.1 hypothetical protein KFF44_00515 [Kordiimonas sp. SCSIO 12610]
MHEDTRASDDQAFINSQKHRHGAATAYQNGDREKALELLILADKIRPNNPAVMGNILFISLETGATKTAKAIAEKYATLGMIPPQRLLTQLYDGIPETDRRAFEKAYTAINAQIGTAEIEYAVPDSLKLIEGIAYHPNNQTFYVSSVVSKGIYKIENDQVSPLIEGDEHQYGSFFGLDIDPENTFLYATFATIDHTPNMNGKPKRTGVLKIDIDSEKIIQTWTLNDSANSQVADLVITNNGQIFLSNSQGKAVYEIKGDQLVKRFKHSGFMSPQGLAKTNDGNLILADYGRGLWHLDTSTQNITLIETSENLSLIGLDGLKASSNRLVATQNGIQPARVIEIELDTNSKKVVSSTIIAKNLAAFDEPTLFDIHNNTVFMIANSQWPKYQKGGILKDKQVQKPTYILKMKLK